MERWLFLVPLLPLLAFAINILLGRPVIKDKAHWVAAPAVFGSFVLALLVLRELAATGQPISQTIYTWIPSGSFQIPVTLYVDQLTAVMLVVVTSVSFLVHVYSVGYMHGDGGYYRFFAYLPLFVFAMLMLVLADNFLLLFVFWEGVGLCSYLLIGFWFRRRSAIDAAKKAFIVNRIGDFGFGLAIMWTFVVFGTLSFQEVFARAGEVGVGVLTGIALLFFLGACGKSAQFPLHVWLPDAMEGPTPVSALIHAATMVTAGIYLVARAQPLFALAPNALVVVALIGAFTAFMGATIGMVQNDIKRVVAYSTVSQLGYMALALGVGAWVAAIFHLLTQAFFKGLLFLGAGSVIHGLHEEQDVRRMGGLRASMPLTFWTFLVGALANAGVVPFSGFWSKDEVILGAWVSPSPVGKVVAVVGLVSAFFTGLYMFRLVFLVFTGPRRFDQQALHPHESPPSMAIPLVLLAIPAALIGFVGFPPEAGPLHRFLEPVFARAAEEAPAGEEVAALSRFQEEAGGAAAAEAAGEPEVSTATKLTVAVVSTLVALAGVALAAANYRGIRTAEEVVAVDRRLARNLYGFLLDKWRWDELYDRVLVQPFKNLAQALWQVVDVGIIDAAVNGIAGGIGAASQRLRHVQTGLVTNYALAIALGMVLLVGIYLGLFSDLFR